MRSRAHVSKSFRDIVKYNSSFFGSLEDMGRSCLDALI